MRVSEEEANRLLKISERNKASKDLDKFLNDPATWVVTRFNNQVPTKHAICPVPKPRQTRSDKWKKRPAVMRYREFADRVRAAGLTITNGCTVTFGLPMPKSWSAKKRAAMLGNPHEAKPDVDNLLKSLLDAVFQEDSHIWKISVEKRWSDEGYIEIIS